ncbi:hypothetical protein ACFQ1S_16760, partial [Kibdelosporangium lantanae]
MDESLSAHEARPVQPRVTPDQRGPLGADGLGDVLGQAGDLLDLPRSQRAIGNLQNPMLNASIRTMTSEHIQAHNKIELPSDHSRPQLTMGIGPVVATHPEMRPNLTPRIRPRRRNIPIPLQRPQNTHPPSRLSPSHEPDPDPQSRRAPTGPTAWPRTQLARPLT